MDKTNFKIIKILKDKPPFSPVLKLVELNGQKVVWKDFSERPWEIKNTWGRLLINHECSILKRLSGVKGIPRLIGKLNDYGFMVEYIEAEPLNKFKPETLNLLVFQKLSQLVEEIHQRGVVHLDLGQRRNILLDKNLQPYFVDFANALYIRKNAFGFKHLFNLLALIDHSALLKFKHRYFPQELTSCERRYLKWFFFTRKFWIFKPKKYRPKDRL